MLKSVLVSPMNNARDQKKKNRHAFFSFSVQSKLILRVCLVTVFPLIFCFQKQFSIFEVKKLVLATQKGQKTKIVLKTQFVKEIKNMQKTIFSVQNLCVMHITRWTLRHLSLSFYFHITLYAAIAAYKYIAKHFPIFNFNLFLSRLLKCFNFFSLNYLIYFIDTCSR